MRLLISILLGITIACACEGIALSRKFNQANRQKRLADEHQEELEK